MEDVAAAGLEYLYVFSHVFGDFSKFGDWFSGSEATGYSDAHYTCKYRNQETLYKVKFFDDFFLFFG